MAAFRLALLVVLGSVLALPSYAQQAGQGAMIQGGAVTRGHAPVAIQAGGPGANIYGDGGTAFDGNFTEIGITNTGTPWCINDVPRTTPGGYHELCFGANAFGQGLLSYNAYNGGSTLPLNCVINGTVIPDCLNINAGILTPPVVVTDNKTVAIAATGATISALTSNSASADLILSYVFCTGPSLPLPNCGGGNYDALRGVAISNSGTTVPIVAGVSGYVLANQAFVGDGPSSVALFGTGAVNVDGGAIWGLNTNVSDRQYRVAQGPGTHNRRVTGAEIDVSASYIDTSVTGILIAGNSVVQPNASTAIGIVGQDFSAPITGSIARWSQAIFTNDGVADLFAFIGSWCSAASHTQTCDSQYTQWIGYVGGVAAFGELLFGPGTNGAHGFNCVTCNHTAYQFQMNYPLNINSGGMVARSTTDQVLQLGGHVDLPTGTVVESRNDAGTLVEPLEILGSNILLNSNTVQVNNGSGITSAVNCSGSPTSGFATINGIVTHC